MTDTSILAETNITSSSIYNDARDSWGPQFVIDGLLSESMKYFFQTNKEDFPWLQWRLPKQVKIKAIQVAISKRCCMEQFQYVEIRAGPNSIPPRFKGRIKSNTICGKFLGPFDESSLGTTVLCDQPITADYITIQIVDDKAVLAIDELIIEAVPHSK